MTSKKKDEALICASVTYNIITHLSNKALQIHYLVCTSALYLQCIQLQINKWEFQH